MDAVNLGRRPGHGDRGHRIGEVTQNDIPLDPRPSVTLVDRLGECTFGEQLRDRSKSCRGLALGVNEDLGFERCACSVVGDAHAGIHDHIGVRSADPPLALRPVRRSESGAEGVRVRQLPLNGAITHAQSGADLCGDLADLKVCRPAAGGGSLFGQRKCGRQHRSIERLQCVDRRAVRGERADERIERRDLVLSPTGRPWARVFPVRTDLRCHASIVPRACDIDATENRSESGLSDNSFEDDNDSQNACGVSAAKVRRCVPPFESLTSTSHSAHVSVRSPWVPARCQTPSCSPCSGNRHSRSERARTRADGLRGPIGSLHVLARGRENRSRQVSASSRPCDAMGSI